MLETTTRCHRRDRARRASSQSPIVGACEAGVQILFLTDTPLRAQRLARDLVHLGSSRIMDVLDPNQRPSDIERASVRVIVSDVSFSRSETIAALRLYLDALQDLRKPFLCILHEASARAHAQATALKATYAVPVEHLAKRLALMQPRSPAATPQDSAVRLSGQAEGAREVLVRILALGRNGRSLEPSLIATGAAYIENALRETDVRSWLEVVWQFDDITHQHCLLVAGLAAGFAQHLGMSRADCERLTQAALLHDVGKSRIPLAILNKRGALDQAERAIVETHPVKGYDMLQGYGYPEEMLAVVRSHHEFLDGSGYPNRLQGRAIPDLVRLVTICDIFGALIERRTYKSPMEPGQAFGVLAGMEGKLDRDLVRAFRSITTAAGPVELRTSA
jgi:putative nucleotidyltransferase with HDIG domain